MMTKRRIAAAVGAALLIVGVVAGREKPAIDLAQERAPRVAAAADDGIDLSKLNRGESSLPAADPFARIGGSAEKNATPVAAKPEAPALPFRYFGRLTENGKTEVFVMRGDELLSVTPGQNLGEYRVDQVGSRSIAFTYLPLKTRQTLDLP